ncbi:DUF2165 family protein [Klebsiella aerogenes]|uniref:DUF2165 family protein n=1 Tax=Klebsiella aerogenes TaxID=548 RepID=UPI002FF4EDD6
MSERMVSRVVCVVMALFPALWGLFSLMNNLTDFTDTAAGAVGPLLSMKDTYGVPGQMWRALTAPWLPGVGLAVITTVETLAGLLGLAGLLTMLRHLNGPSASFARGKARAMLGATCAVLVWGVGFMVVAGDWFMAWQAKVDPLNTQLGAMMYTLPNMLALVILLLQRDHE